MSWDAIHGQPLAIRLLRQALTAGKVAHAYLLAGPEGTGKRTVARELAKALNCLKALPNGAACDECHSCAKLNGEAWVHPDLSWVEPDGRFIKTDQIRALQAEMYARPSEGRVRVAIIDGADRMNPEAGNRILKLLEEPPPHALLLLLTSNLAGVLPTLVSRCQVVHFSPIPPDVVSAALQSRLGLDPGSARLYASLSGGSLGRALAMSGNPEVLQRRDAVLSMLQQLAEVDDINLLSHSESLEKQKESLDEWLDLLLVWLRDSLLIGQTNSAKLLVNADREAEARALAHQYVPMTLIAMMELITLTRERLQRNANARLTLDVMFLRLGEAAKAVGA